MTDPHCWQVKRLGANDRDCHVNAMQTKRCFVRRVEPVGALSALPAVGYLATVVYGVGSKSKCEQ